MPHNPLGHRVCAIVTLAGIRHLHILQVFNAVRCSHVLQNAYLSLALSSLTHIIESTLVFYTKKMQGQVILYSIGDLVLEFELFEVYLNIPDYVKF